MINLTQGTSSVSVEQNASDTNYQIQMDAIAQMLSQYREHETRIKLLESKSKSERETFRYILKNERLIYWILLLFPVALLCAIIFTLEAAGNSIPSSITYTFLSLIGLGTIAELLFLPLKISDFAKKIELIEDELGKIRIEMDMSS